MSPLKKLSMGSQRSRLPKFSNFLIAESLETLITLKVSSFKTPRRGRRFPKNNQPQEPPGGPGKKLNLAAASSGGKFLNQAEASPYVHAR